MVYERGGFFLPHRDSEKLGRMVATLVVVLPSLFSGGELVVRHESAKQNFRFEEAASGNLPSFAAFYADCEHEVLRVTRGRRVCLTDNLVLKPKRRSKKTKLPATAEDVLAASMGSWIAARPAEPLVFALEHQYTQGGLAVDLLKGVDRQTAKLVVAAAAKANCRVHLRFKIEYPKNPLFKRQSRSGRYEGYGIKPAVQPQRRTAAPVIAGHAATETRR